MRVCRASVSLEAVAAETTNARIHPVAYDTTVKGTTQPSKGLPMGKIEGVRRIKHAEILHDAGFLNVGIFSVPGDGRRAKAIRARAITAETVRVRERRLQDFEESVIQDEAFKVDPGTLKFDLDP